MKLHILRIFIVSLVFFANSSVSAQNSTSFNKNLYWNISPGSSEVKKLQQFLKDQGLYVGPINGNFLSATYKAVVAFQTRENITPKSGYFGPATRARANVLITPQAKVTNSTSIPSVSSLGATSTVQVRLAALLLELQVLQQKLARETPVITTTNSIVNSKVVVTNTTTSVPASTLPTITQSTTTTNSNVTASTSIKVTPPAISQSTNTPNSKYPLHTGIIATVFWVGEPKGNGSSEDNALSAWDDDWEEHYGGYDNYVSRNGYFPVGFTPKENPFYLDLPYNDFSDSGKRKSNVTSVIPWANEKTWGSRESMMKNRWVKLIRNGTVCYGQIEDAGPYEYDDYNYVFSTTDARPKSKTANNAGMDVSPALRDCLKFNGLNNADNKVDWQFVDATDVPAGPWKQIITTSQISW